MKGSPPQRRRPRLSQNFLVDERVATRILAAFAPSATDQVLEIGPGRGVLTRALAGRVRRLVAVEIDAGLASGLARRFAEIESVQIVTADALDVSLAALGAGERLRILANLPYAISSPIVLKLLEEIDFVSDVLLMLQREYAERLAAPPDCKAYGSLSVLAQARFEITPLFDVGPQAFRPRPRIHSRLLRLAPRAAPLVAPGAWPALKALLRAAFSGRRKMLPAALALGLGTDRAVTGAWLESLGVDPRCRAEQLSPARWADLAHRSEGLPAAILGS